MVNEFKRETRYLVLKIKDIRAYLTTAQIRQLEKIEQTIEANRIFNGRPQLRTVVVEQDWPEFEPTWAAIEKRMSARTEKFMDDIPGSALAAGGC